jgi:hypothetical protein
MFKVEIDEIFRRCISSEEVSNILFQCHSFIYGGQSLPIWFFLPIIFMDARAFVLECDKCQRTYNITERNEMPLRSILEVKIFDIWGIDFMGPFPSSKGNEYISVAIDYVSKWVETIACQRVDANIMKCLYNDVIFPRCVVPCIIISDGGIYFINK